MFGKKQIILIIAIVAAVLIAAAVVLLTLPKAPSTVPSNESSMDLSDEPSSDLSNEPSSSTVDVLAPHIGIRVSFTSTVYNIRNNRILTSANGALCWVSTDVRSDVPVPLLRVGDPVKVVYDGRIAQSFPGQINVVYEIKKPDGAFPMLTYTLLPKISAQKKLTQIVEQDGELGCAIYYYGLDGMDVTVDGQTMNLQQALGMGIVSAEYWLSQVQRDAQNGKCELTEYKDGGSKLYRYDDYTILKMNTIDGDKTLYIGTADLTIAALNDPLLKITVSQNKQNKPRRVSTWRTAMETDYVMYFVDVDSVKVKTDKGYQDLLSAVQSGKVDMNALRSELVAFARESGSPVICADGLLDGTAYTQTTIRFADSTVTFTGYQSRREVFFSPPNSGGFTQNVKERIAEESAKFPLTVKKSASATLTQVTRPEWDLTYDVCYYNIDSASVMLDGKAVDLLDAISQGRLTFEQLIKDADSLGDWIYNAEYKDGGSMLYRYEDYAILKLNKINGDKTLYIGTWGLSPEVVK